MWKGAAGTHSAQSAVRFTGAASTIPWSLSLSHGMVKTRFKILLDAGRKPKRRPETADSEPVVRRESGSQDRVPDDAVAAQWLSSETRLAWWA
jgi:hypothetical protein